MSYTISDDVLLYATYSEGYRPGLLNRPGGAQGPNGYEVPFELETDDVTNYELGWKADLAGGTLRVTQCLLRRDRSVTDNDFDPSIVNLFSLITLLMLKSWGRRDYHGCRLHYLA